LIANRPKLYTHTTLINATSGKRAYPRYRRSIASAKEDARTPERALPVGHLQRTQPATELLKSVDNRRHGRANPVGMDSAGRGGWKFRSDVGRGWHSAYEKWWWSRQAMERWKIMYMLSTRVSKLFRNDYDDDRKATERQRRHYYIIIILERPPPVCTPKRIRKPTTIFISNEQLFPEGTREKRVGTHNKTGSWPLPPTKTTMGLRGRFVIGRNCRSTLPGNFVLWSAEEAARAIPSARRWPQLGEPDDGRATKRRKRGQPRREWGKMQKN